MLQQPQEGSLEAGIKTVYFSPSENKVKNLRAGHDDL